MVTYLPYILCAILMLFSIKGSIQGSLEEGSAKYSLNRLIYYFSIFITFLIMLTNLDKIYLAILKFVSDNSNVTLVNNNLFKALVLGIVFLAIQTIIYWILKCLSEPLTKAYKLLLSKGKLRIVLFSSLFGFLKGLVIILIMFMGIITYNTTFGRSMKINLFNGINGYSTLESIMSINKPVLSYDDFKEYIPASSNVIVYYNGVTLEDGIKSSKEIDEKATEIIGNAKSDREKAKRLYSWIGSNIKYDFTKAEKALGPEGVTNSGAIEAWNTRSGICFDYACLYVAMAKSVDLGSRIVTGDAFDGQNYGPHAWNQVYLADEGIWINVDPTFYLAGDYFDNKDFNADHLNAQIAGEWL
ncbi:MULTISPECIES: transglutaminase-like domain-containing protein [Clostridium]|uniref:transglutaminase-like domain-containing protein n=1 Tax=Clostridium TaxID=1485 RepID=UPI001D9CF3B5|nr:MULTISPECIES: transglutaminase-like domain-containing protein [Clostridium]MBS5306334.1 transglutaminase domain-containing protein [Clostridium sp.]MDB1943873.1 transglutaminase-like domain-containing protein [Clostridium tertium]MDB1950961.1 transglutaminase-like domain-containing protein [Clostridium tertium]MDU1566494.1 transglutaminase-like domain-containing protein [Clostridium sp.]MDU3523952.1 transglutaminase-like domain-containing protein [Clostridium sp.]